MQHIFLSVLFAYIFQMASHGYPLAELLVRVYQLFQLRLAQKEERQKKPVLVLEVKYQSQLLPHLSILDDMRFINYDNRLLPVPHVIFQYLAEPFQYDVDQDLCFALRQVFAAQIVNDMHHELFIIEMRIRYEGHSIYILIQFLK